MAKDETGDKAAKVDVTKRGVHASAGPSDDNVPGVKTILAWGSIGVLAVLAVTWIGQGNEFFLAKVFAPRMEAVRRATFEQSKAYTDGWGQTLDKMHGEWVLATPAQRRGLAGVILHQAVGHDENKLSADQRAFMAEVRAAR